MHYFQTPSTYILHLNILTNTYTRLTQVTDEMKKKPCASEYSAAGPFYAKLQTHIIIVFIPYFIPVCAYHQQIKPIF